MLLEEEENEEEYNFIIIVQYKYNETISAPNNSSQYREQDTIS